MLTATEQVHRLSRRVVYLPHFIEPHEQRDGSLYALIKPVFDFIVAVALLPIALPLIAFAAMMVRLTSKGPAFYTQVRLGKDGKPYRLYKIRTMIHDCEKLTGACWSKPGDPRITPVGAFLRRTHLDELPQLLNVLKGDMSLVGPRPERPELIPDLEEAVPGYRQRLKVKPGVTGLAQVQLPADTDLCSVRNKLSYDLYYVRQYGFWLDMRLIAATAFKVLGASFRVQRILFGLPTAQEIERISRLPVEQSEMHLQVV
jgi:lipopolysaccharide/colanic/teichoic acid biosynthesis glycosyltransferase